MDNSSEAIKAAERSPVRNSNPKLTVKINVRIISNGVDPVRDQSLMYYIYVMQSRKSKYWYTGSTNDLRKRLNQHTQKQIKTFSISNGVDYS